MVAVQGQCYNSRYLVFQKRQMDELKKTKRNTNKEDQDNPATHCIHSTSRTFATLIVLDHKRVMQSRRRIVRILSALREIGFNPNSCDLKMAVCSLLPSLLTRPPV